MRSFLHAADPALLSSGDIGLQSLGVLAGMQAQH